jgi:Carboxypeptidase regulatory-like domain
MLNRNATALLDALLCASLMFVASPATSQSFYGSLVSVVRDAQGEVIPTATIVLTNTATSERREGVSAENGEYRFVNLVPGTYRREVELSGFQRYVRDQIEVNVQSQPRIEVALQLGTLAETVRVSGASPVLHMALFLAGCRGFGWRSARTLRPTTGWTYERRVRRDPDSDGRRSSVTAGRHCRADRR